MRGSQHFVVILACLVSPSLARVFSNDNLIVDKPVQEIIGNLTYFFCELPDVSQTITKCEYIIPDGSVWTVANGAITDESGGAVAGGYSALDNGNPDRVCGIQISSVAQQDFGDWKCSLTRSGGVTSQVHSVINIRTERYPQTNVMLPGHLTPSLYDLDLIVTLDPDFTIDGYFRLRASVLFGSASTTTIVVHFRDMSFDEPSLKVSGGAAGDLQIIDFTYDFEREMLTVQFDAPAAGESFDADFSGNYRATLGTVNGVGFYRDSYTDVNSGQTVWMGVTQFETNDARMAFPCMDEPAQKAVFNVRLGHKDTLVAQSNGALLDNSQPVDGYAGYVWSEFEQTPIVSTYLIAFAVSNYVSVDSVPLANGVEHTTWARYDAIDDGLASYIVAKAPHIIECYENTFSVTYKMPKLEQISPPNKGGAMENWGLITYSEAGLLIDVTTASAYNEMYLVNVQSHEMAHQWYGNLVTCDWWSYIWLNEGFATYVSYVGAEWVAPYMHNYNLFVHRELTNAMHADDTADSHEISDPIVNAETAHFGSITYDKGSCLVRMVEHFISRNSWTRGLTNYLNARSFSTAVPDDLFYYWDEAAKADGTLEVDKSVKTIMDTWTLQKNFPVVTVTRDYVAGTATLTQERFLLEPDTTGDSHDYNWWIPITYSTVGDQFSNFNDTFNYNQWFPADRDAVTVTTGGQSSPVIFNVQYTSFYRTNYDATNWDRISQALFADPFQIHESNRLQLLTDSYELAKAGILSSYDVAIDIAAYLPAETQYAPIATAAYNLKDVRSQGSSSTLENSLLSSFVSLYGRIGGMVEGTGTTWNDHMVQMEVIKALCDQDYQACVDDATADFAAWMALPDPDDLSQNPTNRHARSQVYCAAVRNGGDAEYNFILARLAAVRNPQERNNLNSAKKCRSSKEALVQTLAEFMAAPQTSDAEEVSAFLARNPVFPEALRQLYFDASVNDEAYFKQDRLAVISEALKLTNDLQLLSEIAQLHEDLFDVRNPLLESSIRAVERNMRLASK